MIFLKKNKYQILRFIVVGLFSNLINYTFYSLIYLTNLGINIASVVGYLAGLLNSFYFSKKWVFKNPKVIRLDKAFLIFFFIYLLGGIEMTLVINFFDMALNNHKLAWLIGASTAALNNYLGTKYFLFED